MHEHFIAGSESELSTDFDRVDPTTEWPRQETRQLYRESQTLLRSKATFEGGR